ncbi:DNA gyrase inhibitor, partial [Enterobacter hormaechei]
MYIYTVINGGSMDYSIRQQQKRTIAGYHL